MKYLILILLCGCADHSIQMERWTEQLGQNNASFRLSVPVRNGTITVERVNPTIGFSATAGQVTTSTPTNIPIQVIYHTITPSPTMPQSPISTNQLQRSP